jgi:hypothetical protein
VTVPAVVGLHLADDAECACAYLSGLDAQGGRNVPGVKPREQHADDRKVIDVEPRRGRLDELRIWRQYPRGPVAAASIAASSASTGSFLETIASACASVAGTAKASST